MFKAFRDAPLMKMPGGSSSGYYAVLEAWKYHADSEITAHNFTTSSLHEDDLHDWVWQKGRFHATARQQSDDFEGGIRLLLAQPKSSFRQAIPENLISCNVLDALGLPQNTFVSFQTGSGLCSAHTCPQGSTVDSCEKLTLVFKTPQKRECTNGALAVSHNFNSGITTALSLGFAFNLDDFDPQSPALSAFIQQIKDCRSNWNHPLTLPCIFLVAHVLLVRSYVYVDLSQRVVFLERCIGVIQAGRSPNLEHSTPKYAELIDDMTLYNGEYMLRDHAKKLIVSLNDLSTSVLFANRSPQWDMDCAKLILSLLSGNQRLQFCQNIPAQLFKEILEYVISCSEACSEATQTSQARLQLQLNILYASIAQDDGQTNARLATSAGRDSASMKIIALITAIYLPGTFVASLFSMGMFDWQSGSTGAVAQSFWVYWAVSVPLTIITILGWALWWQQEKERFKRDVQQEPWRGKSGSLSAKEKPKSHIVQVGSL